MQGARTLIPIFIVFILGNLIPVVFRDLIVEKGIAQNVILAGNAILFLLTLFTIAFQKKALGNKNPNVFIRSIMSSMLIKMLVMAGAVIVYAKASGPAFNKGGIFSVLILYLLYLAAEVYTVMKMNSRKNA